MILLGKKLKALRMKHKYTQPELATLVGVTKSTIAAYENDTRLPSYDVLIKLSHVLKTSTDYLLLDKQSTGIDTTGLNEEQIGALSVMVEYFKACHPQTKDYFIYRQSDERLTNNIIETFTKP
ncbi:MAG: helix-turn-helix transcriptional regulator [Lachnospiraceae bacterium]|nr:helix-turn-helix transcriptional regulator [Lachnospiraceae bacterium]